MIATTRRTTSKTACDAPVHARPVMTLPRRPASRASAAAVSMTGASDTRSLEDQQAVAHAAAGRRGDLDRVVEHEEGRALQPAAGGLRARGDVGRVGQGEERRGRGAARERGGK